MEAPGAPGLSATWTSGAKQGVGAAISPASRVAFTIGQGILNEVYFPRLDQANTRDCQLLLLLPDGTFVEEKRDLRHRLTYLDPCAPAFEVTAEDPGGRFRLRKRIYTWPEGDVLIQRVRLEVLAGPRTGYRAFCLLAPRIGNQGAGNSASWIDCGSPALLAWRAGTYLCLAAGRGFLRRSVGFVGVSDGWQLLRRSGELIPYDEARDGNVALTGEILLEDGAEEMLLLSFGHTAEDAAFGARLCLEEGPEAIERAYVEEWRSYMAGLTHLLPEGHPHARAQRISAMVLKVHTAKAPPGGIIASLAIPWGTVQGDQNIGGYHLVWTRDMTEAAHAYLALGDVPAARRALRYLQATQRDDGSWPQNFWLDGRPYWTGLQLDEVAFPVHLAYRLWAGSHLGDELDPYPMVKRALAFLVRHGPVTQEERWEEDGGYSPSTLAAVIAALVVGAEMARARGEAQVADYCLAIADSYAEQVDDWTYTQNGDLLGFREYYERIRPEWDPSDDHHAPGLVRIPNLPPYVEDRFPETSLVDGGFLELVRYGIKAADDPKIVRSVAVLDALLKVDTPSGPVWHRYNHDGYGEHADGSPYDGYGQGRAWPLLTGERGHYELALGRDVELYLDTMERCAGEGGLIPEQVWDTDPIPERGLAPGRPTGSAMPLVWAHAEYLKLLRSALDGRVFERLEPVYDRYVAHPRPTGRVLWQFNHQIGRVQAGKILRINVGAPAVLHLSRDGWRTAMDIPLADSGLGMYFADLPVSEADEWIRFTFYWTQAGRWEGRDFAVRRAEAT